MIELTERIGAEPVFRVTPTERAILSETKSKKKEEGASDAKDRTKKEATLSDEDDKGKNFDETV